MLSNIKNWVNSSTTKDNINSIIQKISFIQNTDSNNVDDIKKIEADLISYFEKDSDFQSIMSFKRTAYGPSPLLFFFMLKE